MAGMLLAGDNDRVAPLEVRVWIESAAVPWARETPAFGFQREEPAEGGTVFVYHSWDLRRLMPWVLSWGASARVLSPPDVAQRIHREAAALTQRYAGA
jgi:predicted DNA-binding transcriptional regulator YafY